MIAYPIYVNDDMGRIFMCKSAFQECDHPKKFRASKVIVLFVELCINYRDGRHVYNFTYRTT
jgi:hypothetical protein